MKVIYGKEALRIDLTHAVKEINWSSSRGQLAQVCDISLDQPPALQAAGFLMLFTENLTEKEQLFHGPLVRFQRSEPGNRLSATAYELGWYLQKNELSRTKLSGDAGKELERLVKSTGIAFSCPAFGVRVNERIGAQSYAALFTMLTEKAFDQTGVRYYVQHQRDKLSVVAEGANQLVPLFRADRLTSSSGGESIEEVYTVVTVERYANDRLAESVSKESASLIQQIGRMQKRIDAGEEKNLSSLAQKQLTQLSKIPRTRSVTVVHDDVRSAFLRAGWAIKIQETDKTTVTDWIVTSCRARWKAGQYTMDLELERRE